MRADIYKKTNINILKEIGYIILLVIFFVGILIRFN